MNVVETDPVVSGMLNDELMRCEEALSAINRTISSLPKGSLTIRRKRHKQKLKKLRKELKI